MGSEPSGTAASAEDLLEGHAPFQSRSLTVLGGKADPINTGTRSPSPGGSLSRW